MFFSYMNTHTHTHKHTHTHIHTHTYTHTHTHTHAHNCTHTKTRTLSHDESFPIFVGFRPISGAFPAFPFSQIFNFPTETLISFFPEHFKWFTGAVPQFVAVLQEHKLILFLKKMDEAFGRGGGEHDVERTI